MQEIAEAVHKRNKPNSDLDIGFSLFPRSTIRVGIEGVADFGRISSDEPVSLGGTLSVILQNGFTLTSGNTFDILTYASHGGIFQNTLINANGTTFNIATASDGTIISAD